MHSEELIYQADRLSLHGQQYFAPAVPGAATCDAWADARSRGAMRALFDEISVR